MYIPMIIVWAIGGNIVIIYYANKKCGLGVSEYITNVMLPLVGTSIVMVLFWGVSYMAMHAGFLRLVITCVSTTIGMFVAAYFFAMTKEEKDMLMGLINEFLRRKRSDNE